MRMVIAIGAAALLAACADGVQRPASEFVTNMAHVHMGYVLASWQAPPDQLGVLPTAQAEAEVAAQHAGFAASRPDNLDWMKLHASQVVNAVDPSVEAQRPGLGYGLRQATQGVVQHVRFAAASVEASNNVRLHAGHVETSAGNVIVWSERVVDLGQAAQHMQLMEESESLA